MFDWLPRVLSRDHPIGELRIYRLSIRAFKESFKGEHPIDALALIKDSPLHSISCNFLRHRKCI